MSAFLVSREHIQYLVNAARHYTRDGSGCISWLSKKTGKWQTFDGWDRALASKVGQILWDANVKSMIVRYGKGISAETYKHPRDPEARVENVQVLKAVLCMDYQSCESDDWESSEAHAILEAIKSAAITSLPGYNEAEWSL